MTESKYSDVKLFPHIDWDHRVEQETLENEIIYEIIGSEEKILSIETYSPPIRMEAVYYDAQSDLMWRAKILKIVETRKIIVIVSSVRSRLRHFDNKTTNTPIIKYSYITVEDYNQMEKDLSITDDENFMGFEYNDEGKDWDSTMTKMLEEYYDNRSR